MTFSIRFRFFRKFSVAAFFCPYIDTKLSRSTEKSVEGKTLELCKILEKQETEPTKSSNLFSTSAINNGIGLFQFQLNNVFSPILLFVRLTTN